MSIKSITDYPDAPDIESYTWDYAGRFSGRVGGWLLEQQTGATRQVFEKNYAGRTGMRVLDVGGGHGQNIALMRELGHSLTIFSSADASTEVINQSLERSEVALDTGSLLRLPYEDNCFDVVICYRILSHMESWKALAGELSRVARDLVLVDYPSKRSVNVIADALFLLKKRIEKNTRRYGVFSDSEIDEAFGQNGLNCIYRHRQFFLPMALYRAIGNTTFCRFAARMFRATGLTALFGSPVIAGYSASA